MERKGSEVGGRWLLKALGAWAAREKEGVGSVPCGAGEGAEGGAGSTTWASMARTWQLWAAPTAVGGARLMGATPTGEDGGAR
jgi:hypothetical protein